MKIFTQQKGIKSGQTGTSATAWEIVIQKIRNTAGLMALTQVFILAGLNLGFAVDFSATLSVNQKFNRPNQGTPICESSSYGVFTSTSGGSTQYVYATQSFTVSTAGDYIINVTSSSASDPMIFVYNGSFNAGSPLSNFKVGCDDASGSLNPRISCGNNFAVGTYVIVVSTFSSSTTSGVVNFSVTGGGAIVVLPTVTTNAASGIGSSSVTLGGNCSSDGGATVYSSGVAWSTSANPTSGTAMSSGIGAFSGSVTGLSMGTTYYARAYATNSVGTAYGPQISFGTLSSVAPSVSTGSIGSVTLNSASCNTSNVTSDGGATVSARGIVYNTSSSPTLANGVVTSGSGTGTYNASMSSLGQSTRYYVRAYATNSVGTSYGSEQSFVTDHIVTYASNGNGTVNPTSVTVANGGSGTAITATPAANYHFLNWSDGSTVNPRTETGVTGSKTVSANFAINRLEFSVQPSVTRAGQPISFTVRIKDSYGNTMINSPNTITVAIASSNPAGGTIAGTTTMVIGAGSGTAVFNGPNITKTGSYTLSATASPLTGITSGSFTILSAATADHFHVSGITDPVVAGTTTSPLITVHDLYDNVKTDYTGTIVFSSAEAHHPDEVLPSYTFISADNGIKILVNGVTLKTTGERSVTVTGDTKTGSQTAITVTPAAINEFILVANGTITAGTPFTVTATVKDIFGNIKTNYTGSNSVNWVTTATSSLNGTARIIPANGNQTFTEGVSTIGGFTFFNSMETPIITITDSPSSKPGTTSAITVHNAALDNFKVVAGTTQNAGIPFSVTVTARDVYWNTCIDYAGSIRFKSSDDELVTFPAGLQSFAPAGTNLGVRTFTSGITINAIGAYWLRAADSAFAYKSGQQENIVVGPGAFSSLVTKSTLTISDPSTPLVFADPLSRIAGEHVLVTVIPRDSQGNLLYACRDISVMLNTSTSDYDGPIVVQNVGDGSYTASVRVTQTGDNIISAEYNSTHELFLQTRTAAVTAVATRLIIFTEPSATATAGVVFTQQPVVRIEDGFGNLITNDNSTIVTATRLTGTDVLKGTLTATASGGVATFAGLYYTKAESITLEFSSNPALATATSTSILVGHAPVDHFDLNAPSNFIAGSTRAAYTVTRHDIFHNPVTTGSQIIYLLGSSDGANKRFYNAASAGSVITQLTIADGASSANFWYYDEKTGDHTITGSDATPADGATGIIDGTDQITVTPALLKDFIVSGAPDPHDFGTWQSATVEARDTYGNRKTNYTGRVTFSNTDNAATNPADYFFTTGSGNDNGIHTFPDLLKFSQPGNWWLTALDWNEPAKYGAQPDITVQRAVTVTANDRSKTYGNVLTMGTTEFTVTDIVSGLTPIDHGISGVTLTSSGSAASIHVGSYNIVPTSATGTYNPDYYRIVYSSAGQLTIGQRTLTLNSFLADNKTYDRNTDVTGPSGSRFSDNRVSGDDLSFSYTAAFEDKNVANGKTVNYTGISISGGTDQENYTLNSITTGSATADITPKTVTPAIVANNKCYDGGTTATLSSQYVNGVISPDVVTLLVAASNFADAAVGAGKLVTASGLTLGGADAGNYTLYGVTTATNTAEIYVIPELSSTLTPTAICNLATFHYTPESLTPGATFAWTRATVEGISNSSASGSNDPSETLTNTTVAPVNVTYAYITTSPQGCSHIPQNVVVTVNPTAQVSQPTSQVVCNAASTALVTFATTNTGGTTTYTWTNSLTSIGLAASGSSDIDAFTATNASGAPVIATIVVTPHFLNDGVTCDGPTKTFTITVNPTAQVNAIDDQVVCNDASTTLVEFGTTNTGGTTTYTWTNNTTSIGLDASGTGNIDAFTAVNTGTAPVVATIIITPHFLNDGVTCDGPTKTFTITVNPTAQVNAIDDQVVCNDASTTLVTFATTNTGGTTTYTWTNSLTSIGLAASGSSDIDAFTATNASGAPVIATIVVTPHFLNDGVTCDGPTKTFTITVNPTAQVNAIDDQVVCNDASTTLVEFGTTNTGGTTTYTWTNNTTSIGLDASGTGNIDAFTATNASGAPVIATIVVTPHFLNDGVTCDGPTKTFTITVNPTAQVNAIDDQVVCNDASTTLVEFGTTNTGGTTTYTWTNSLTSIGLAASGSSDIAAFTATNASGAPVIATIVVTPHFLNDGVTCDGPTKTFTITVNPTAQVSQPTSQVVCNAASTALVTFATTNTGGTTTYTWTNSLTSIGLAASGSSDIAAFTATNASGAPVIATIVVTPHFLNDGVTCDGPTKTFTITVNPTAQVNAIDDQVVCNDASTTLVEFGTTNTGGTTTYTWTNSLTSIGLAASGSSDIAAFTATNASGAPVIATIVVTPHFLNDGVTCDGPTKTFTITVNPTVQVNAIDDQVVCNDASTTLVEFGTTNTGGTTTYTWTNNTTSIGLDASGTGNIDAFTAVNSTGAPVIATIVVTPHFLNDGVTCDGPTETFTITVNPTAQVNAIDDQVVCNDASTTLVEFGTTNTGGTTTYTWTNNTTSIGLDASGTGNIDAFTAVNTGTAPVVATIIITPHFLNDGVTCDGPTKTFTITVNPTAQVNAIDDQVVCNAASTALVTFATTNTGGTTTYTWTNNTTSIGLDASGTGNIDAFTAVNTGTAPVVATIIITPHFLNDGVTCNGPTKTFTITVNPTAQVSQPTSQVVCNAASTTLVTFATTNTGGTTTYTWTNSLTSIGLAASGSSDIAAFTATNATGAPVIATIVVTPHFLNDGVTCDGPTKTFTITVNPTAQVNAIDDQVVCNDASTTLVTFATTNTGGTTTYTWTNSLTSIGLAASGSSDIAAFTATNASGAPIIATIVVTPHFLNDGVTCDGPNKTFTITVNPTAQVSQPTSQVVCNAASTTLVTFATTNTGGTTTYTWTNSLTSIGLAASGSSDIAAFTATNASGAPVFATIVVTPHFLNDGVTCDGPTKTFTITVNPTAQVSQPTSQVVCNAASTTLVTFATTNTGGTTTYTWTNSLTSIGLAASGSSDIDAFTATNASGAPVIATIVVTPHFLNDGVTCDGPTKTFTITVNPTAQVSQPASKVVCNAASTALVTFATTKTGGTTTYTWTNNTTSIGLDASGTGNIDAFTAVNTGTAPVVATIIITPHFLNDGVTCDGPTKTFTITVNPTAQVNAIDDQVVCNDASTTLVEFATTNTGGTTTYTWTNSLTSIGLAASGSSDIAAFTATNSTGAPVIATIVVTPHFLNDGVTCDGPTKTFTITVNPTAQVNAIDDQVVCNDASTTLVEFATTNTGGTTTYTWTNSLTSIGLAASGSSDIAAFTATNATGAPVIATIVVTPHFLNDGVTCDGPTKTFTITVNPTAVMTDPTDQVVCNGAHTTVTFASAYTEGEVTYTWTSTNASVGLNASGTGNITFTATNPTASQIMTTITVTPVYTNGGTSCPGVSQTFTITVRPVVIPTVTGPDAACLGTTGLIYSTEAGMTGYTWTISGGTITANAGNSIEVTWDTAGDQWVEINYTNSNGCSALIPTQYNVTVHPLPVPTIVSGPSAVCAGTAGVVYTTRAYMTNYLWTLSAGGNKTAFGTTADNNITITWNTSGSQWVKANYTDENGCYTANSIPLIVLVNVLPIAGTISGGSAVCMGSSLALSSHATGTGTLSYTWASSSPGVATVNNSGVVTPVSAGSANITYTVTDGSTTHCQATSATYAVAVNALPVAGTITGGDAVCMGSSLALSSHAAGTGTLTYSWASSNASVATVNNSGVVTPVSAGTANITYTVTDGSTTHCQATSATYAVTVNALPVAGTITGGDAVCMGSSLVLSSHATGTGTLSYTWASSNAGIATVNNSGVVTTVSAGTANITYTVTDGSTTHCQATSATYAVVVNALTVAGTITGGDAVCIGSSLALSSHATGIGTLSYTWASSNAGIATVNNSGVVTAVSAGTANITYTVTDGSTTHCQATSASHPVVVNALPVAGAITGGSAVCLGGSLALSSHATGSGTLTYTWASSNASVATVNNSGVVTPVSAGTANITYTVTDGSTTHCQATSATYAVTVNALPVAGTITGGDAVCMGSSLPLSSHATGTGTLSYTWASSNAGIATVNNSGVVTPVSKGTSNITYTVTDGSTTHCQATSATYAVTVNALPVAGTITGGDAVCMGSSLPLSSHATGTGTLSYTWASSNAGIATVNNSGVVTPVSKGTSNITYTVTDGSTTHCQATLATYAVTVNALPVAGTITGGDAVCIGSSLVLSSHATGTGTLSYTWASSNSSVATVNNSGIVTPISAGKANITYTVTDGSATNCQATSTTYAVAVNALPVAGTITGGDAVCIGSSLALSSHATGTGTLTYTWASSNAGAATVNNSGVVTPVSAGTANITYTVTDGSTTHCQATSATYAVVVNALPAAIAGADRSVCLNAGTTLGSAPLAGSTYRWSSEPAGFTSAVANPSVSPLVSTTFTVVETITATGCTNTHSVVVTVSPLPIPTIIGSATACAGSTGLNYFTEPAMTGYVWTVSAGGIITAGGATNMVTVSWNTAGNHTVSVNYFNVNGCAASSASVKNITVNPSAGIAGNITGTTTVCGGSRGVAFSTTAISNAVSYAWTLPDGATISSGDGTKDIKVDFAANGSSGNISVNGNNACSNGTASTLAITVTPRPDAAGAIAGPATFGQGTTGANYSVDPVANATNYTWTLPAGATIYSGANTSNITVDFSMSAVSGVITVYGSNSCESGTVSPALAVTMPEAQFGVYPVPSDGLFNATISSPVETTFNIRIYNHLGDKIMEIKDARTISGEYHKAIDLRPIPSGIYYVEFFNGQFREVRKVLVNR